MMKAVTRVLILGAAVAWVTQIPMVAQSTDPALQKAIDARRTARAGKDIETYRRLTADDAMEIHSDGKVHSKAEEATEIRDAAPPDPKDGPDTDKKIRVYGSTAVLTYQRNPADGPRRMSQVWVKGANGQWQAVLTQQSPIPKR